MSSAAAVGVDLLLDGRHHTAAPGIRGFPPLSTV